MGRKQPARASLRFRVHAAGGGRANRLFCGPGARLAAGVVLLQLGALMGCG